MCTELQNELIFILFGNSEYYFNLNSRLDYFARTQIRLVQKTKSLCIKVFTENFYILFKTKV